MEALTQSLRLETVGSGVKVTSIQPGMGTVEPLYTGHLGDVLGGSPSWGGKGVIYHLSLFGGATFFTSKYAYCC